MRKLYTVTELAEALGVTPRALRFYEDKGLVTPQRAGTTRVYTHRDRGRLALILRGKRLGFSLREVGEWLDLYDADPNQGEQMRLLVAKVHERIAGLERQRDDLEETLSELREIEKAARRHLDTKAAEGRGKHEAAAVTPPAEI
ncbi:MAG: MerR family DNA-binding transcriptional regulator [Rhodospirillales bacterium]|nr:MerR family DNA-binding transcriptional regulator [Rhodospirillales bacterium]MDH3909826.1 MerR family DNA-binding transcriptional regulator [Rhodospirillales bacterium]MDH3919154.1 MerR family DNA-binding transcriptional regulator [Rhodospirillales bacterium]MDH3966691.1 MerR family DNA-binding transcriptional regulator [Rhodospirillales bacterium]